ncbi:hypothetical protein GHO29_12625 [Pseudomonas helleri]|uniref:Uncharacterized protein n=1 Tax=Pseudomonas helleri TaxID=1608996 RepID=A0A7X1XZ29_9PSED|nr:hypothetical protein [Pseudomonas helleri]MQU27331.1 hypothetical protein [Pseudomonas helleri]
MDVKDFATDEDRFKKKIGVRRFDVNSATQKLLSLADLWSSVAQENLGGLISITAAAEDARIDGEVLGKKFCIRYAPFGLEGEGTVEAALSIQDLVTGKSIELSRFLVSSKGAILTIAGEELINSEHSEYGYKVLVAIATRVINAPSKA